MIKIDLITGFLGSGKTTFIIKYAKYLMSLGERICILENDYGAVNIDMMLVSDIGCDREMIAGGCDYDCHKRRFKTKLINMALMGYSRIIVEPSGIFDTDEFFDLLYEEPLDSLYEIANVFSLYDINTKNLSYESRYILASQISVSSKIIISKRDNSKEELNIDYLNNIMKEFNCPRIITESDIIYNDNIDFNDILYSGHKSYSHIKIPINNDNNYDSIYYLDKDFNKDMILKIRDQIFNTNMYGLISRIKGFIYENNNWYRINITKNEFDFSQISEGQKVLIIIGESMNKDNINNLIESALES